MKPKNFPARRLRRQINAQSDNTGMYTPDEEKRIAAARQIRTKKNRSNR